MNYITKEFQEMKKKLLNLGHTCIINKGTIGFEWCGEIKCKNKKLEEEKITMCYKKTNVDLLYDELVRKKHNCIRDNPKYNNDMGLARVGILSFAWCGNYDECIYKITKIENYDNETKIIEKILNNEQISARDLVVPYDGIPPRYYIGFIYQTEWCKIHSKYDGEKEKKYIDKIKKLFEENNHICLKITSTCGIEWCENINKCLLKESIDNQNKNNDLLLKKLTEDKHKCIEIIDVEPKFIKWCNCDLCINAQM